MARVLGFGKISSSITYTLEDGTCRGISARQWLSDGGDTLSEDYRGYVHVVGQLDTRTQSRFKNVLVVKTIRALKDDPADQLAFNILQAAYVTLCLERGPPVSAVVDHLGHSSLTAQHHRLCRCAAGKPLDMPVLSPMSRHRRASFPRHSVVPVLVRMFR